MKPAVLAFVVSSMVLGFPPSVGGNTDIFHQPSVVFNGPIRVEANTIHNIHINYVVPINGTLSIHYGPCDIIHSMSAHHQIGITLIGDHPLATQHAAWKDQRPERFVWTVPNEVPDGGCLHAFSGRKLVGRSVPITVAKKRVRRRTVLGDIADSEGPWFDGVEYLREKEPESVFVAQTKEKAIGIIGGGISGLMSAFLLDSIGIHNWKIIEASDRIGGRIRTTYFNNTSPDDYQYQEMGAMRFPVSVTYAGTNHTLPILDHRMVFQLVSALNLMNGKNSSLGIKFIDWIHTSSNQPAPTSKRRPDGTVPGAAEVADDPSLQMDSVPSCSKIAVEEAGQAYRAWVGFDRAKLESLARNIFVAHKQAIDNGLFEFSESGYLRHRMKLDLDITDQADSLADLEPSWLYDRLYFSATNWATIDKGVSRLPSAFEPLTGNRTIFETTVQELEWNESTGKMAVKWRPKGSYDTETSSMMFDYVIVSVPFSKVRLWRLPSYSSLLSRAIKTLNYKQACKVSLHYRTRFWEHLEHPIIGGCGSTDIPGIGMICYPSYQINSSGPGAILASYQIGNLARSLGSMTEQEHVALAQRAMIEVHGDIAREQFTGASDRVCWENEGNAAGAYCAPLANQQQLYLPAYFRTEKHTVFVGEHTSYTHAWVWSALESAVRGTTQLLLEMGLVDEAKSITEEWMARWITM